MGLIAIGDVHGCPDSLDALLDRLAPASDDHLVFIGDYIDRGPDSKRVIDRLLALREEQPCTFLRGNHEALMLDYLQGEEGSPAAGATRALRLWQQNGGGATLRSYANGQTARLPEAHVAFVRETRLYYETPDFFFVHAGLKPERTVRENVEADDERTFLWERGHLEAPELAWEKPVVCGHTPQREPINHEKLIAIDTGCVYHRRAGLGRLTAVRLPERAFVSVDYVG
ncbi:MAG: serine/threonine protein phosphatase [Bacteroidetes bacterium QH_8_67_23]|jgi:serine/threonine protein phosphatase 1|nr:MAG: serine/threonine protein phosphatase [Bacteroidetes bacterium QH_8_67_23]